MGIREVAGDMARNTSGIWKGIADAVDPSGRPTRSAVDARIDLTQTPASEPPVAGPSSESGDDFGDRGGRMLVPLDTWTRILEQVGHVHEAGQQLADAKERAARAETENRFLHEQLKELKAQRRPTRRAAPKAAASPVSAPVAPDTSPAAAESRGIRARRRVSRWLSP